MTKRDESYWRSFRHMSEELQGICVEAVRNCDELRGVVRENAEVISNIEISVFDQSYIEFLEGQIALEPRGPEWTIRLQKRITNLCKYTDREIAACRLRFEDMDYWLKIDPTTKSVIHWESYHE